MTGWLPRSQMGTMQKQLPLRHCCANLKSRQAIQFRIQKQSGNTGLHWLTSSLQSLQVMSSDPETIRESVEPYPYPRVNPISCPDFHDRLADFNDTRGKRRSPGFSPGTHALSSLKSPVVFNGWGRAVMLGLRVRGGLGLMPKLRAYVRFRSSLTHPR